ncbi:MAG: Ig-like domain-containing protein [Pirellulales bacterium]|nr:Ig-like domain-containing protein [Pirellulales bacterium]
MSRIRERTTAARLAIPLVLLAMRQSLAGGPSVDVSRFVNPAFRAQEKKVIGFAWASPSPSVLRDRMKELETAAPYLDGIVFKLPETPLGEWPPWRPAFDNRRWTESDVGLPVLCQVKWGRFRHNFIALGPGSSYDHAEAGWFDDEAWSVIVENAGLLSRAILESGARGVFFDTEKYSGLWHYWHRESLRASPPRKICLYPGFTFGQVEKKVRQRGREFLAALQSHKPDVVVFATFLTSACGKEPDSVETSDFPLLRAFTAGMLDAAGPRATLVDGLENTYWTPNSQGYLWWHEQLKDQTVKVVPDDVREKWRSQCSTGMAVFYDAVAKGLYTEKLAVGEDYRTRWLEHNAYHAVLTNDEWTWVYFEKTSPWKPEDVGPGFLSALARGIDKAKGHAPLGFDMTARTLDLTEPSRYYEDAAVRLRSPLSGEVFRRGQTITVQAEPTGESAIQSLRVFVDSRPVASLSAAPWRVGLTNCSTGPHTVRAEATVEGNRMCSYAAPVIIWLRP